MRRLHGAAPFSTCLVVVVWGGVVAVVLRVVVGVWMLVWRAAVGPVCVVCGCVGSSLWVGGCDLRHVVGVGVC